MKHQKLNIIQRFKNVGVYLLIGIVVVLGACGLWLKFHPAHVNENHVPDSTSLSKERAIPTVPDSPQVYEERARAFVKENKLDQAIAVYKQAIDAERNSARQAPYYNELGVAQLRKGNLNGAIESLEKASSLTDDPLLRAEVGSLLAECYAKAGEVQKAREAYLHVAEGTSHTWEKANARSQILRMYEEAGEVDKLVALYETELEKDPNNVEIIEALASVYAGPAKKPQKALSMIERLAKLKPDDKNTQLRLANLYQANQKYNEAIMVYEKIMESAPENEKYHYAARVAAVWQGAGENDRALTWLEQVVEKWPNNPLLRFTLAESYLQSGRFDEARSNFELAVNSEGKPDKKDELLFKIAKDWVNAGLVEDAKVIYARVAESGRNEIVRRRAKVLLADIDRKNANDKAGSPDVR